MSNTTVFQCQGRNGRCLSRHFRKTHAVCIQGSASDAVQKFVEFDQLGFQCVVCGTVYTADGGYYSNEIERVPA